MLVRIVFFIFKLSLLIKFNVAELNAAFNHKSNQIEEMATPITNYKYSLERSLYYRVHTSDTFQLRQDGVVYYNFLSFKFI